MNSKELIKSINNSTNGGMFNVVEKILRLYYKKIYKGSHNKFVLEKYFTPELWWEIIFHLGSEDYVQEKRIKKLNKYITKFINKRKEETFFYRQNIYNLWLECVYKNLSLIEVDVEYGNKLLNNLCNHYKNINDELEVKEELDLLGKI